jgi:hypothetical protein
MLLNNEKYKESKMQYSYLSEKLSAARSCLMLPHPGGEADSIVCAFIEISLGLDGLNKNNLVGSLREWVEKLEEYMNTDGLEDPSERGLYLIKAEQFTTDEKIEISRLVDELASWFDQND